MNKVRIRKVRNIKIIAGKVRINKVRQAELSIKVGKYKGRSV